LVAVGLLVTLEAKPGKEDDLVAFLEGALPLVEQEPQTTAWFAVRLAASRFGIFDAFPTETGREAHLSGPVAAALMESAPELLASAPIIETVECWRTSCPARRYNSAGSRVNRVSIAWAGRLSSRVVAHDDQALPPDASDFANRMGATTIEVPSDHLAMVPHPAEVVKLTEIAAEGAVADAVN
jgi:quinol monooxygenase YgiN